MNLKPGHESQSIHQMIGEFKLIEKIGESGLGPIFLGEHSQTGEKRVFRTLAPGYDEDIRIRDAFKSQDSSSHLLHPNILKVYGSIEHNGSLAVGEEYIEGATLDIFIDSQGLLSVEDCLPIFKELCAALSYAHKKGAIHSEINPRNIFLENSTRRTVLKGFQFPEGLRPRLGTNLIMGNPSYFSPEQCTGETFDLRSDIYSLGALFYFMLTRQRPFRGKNVCKLIRKHIEDHPPRPKELNPQIPRWLSMLVMKMLAKTPEQRYQSCDEILATILRVTETAQNGLWNSWDDRYFLLEKTKQGLCSSTYLALDQNNGERRVAITILTEEAMNEDRQAIERRAQIISKLPEAHFPRVYQSDLEPSYPHIIEDSFPGQTLGQRVEELGALEPAAVLDLGFWTLTGLRAVHTMGLVHGALTAETIFLTRDQQIKLLGSNFNKIDESIEISCLELQFISPEQFKNPRQTVLNDLYAVGICLYYASTGAWPFNKGSSRRDIHSMKSKALPKAPLLLNSNISPALSNFIMKLLAISPKDRYPSAEKALMDLKWIAASGRLPNAPKTWFGKLWN